MIKPMLCEKTTEQELKWFSSESWKANIKYDGERIIAVKQDGKIFLFNRRGRLKNTFYAEVVEDLEKIELNNFIIDGEVISLDDDFNKLQRRALTTNSIKQEQLRKEIPVKYMIFDMIQYETDKFPSMPLIHRVEMLKTFIDYSKFESLGFVAYEDIAECLEYAKEHNCEGIIIKNMNSAYEQRRSSNWVKLKFFKTTTLTLTSYTINNAGLRCEDKELNAVQVSGKQSDEVKELIDNVGYCEAEIQYLEQSEKTKRYRFPSFVGVKGSNLQNYEEECNES